MTHRLATLPISALLFFGLAISFVRAAPPDHTGSVSFNRDIRPILSENCFRCHGADKNARKAKLRLDDRDVALEKGAIVPGQPEKSELVARIFATDEDDIMPPPASHKTLTGAQRELLKKWIAEGAKYEPHWAYIKPIRPEVPVVKNQKWIRNPIDAFVLQQLEAKNILPSPEADKATLLRRLSLDLIGLPPIAQSAKSSPRNLSVNGYDREIERLLASPHFGERMAVPWLDVVRFADTVGYHGDQNQNIFPYRDYVIDALNKNKPLDQFTIEQIAGDLLPKPTPEQRIATGFNRLNMVTREGGAQPQEYLAKYAADRARTIGTAWLGSTIGCAECHDHKYDPFSTRDFYQLEAFFSDIKQWGVYNDYPYTPNPDLKGWSNDHPFPPELEVENSFLERRRDRLRKEISDLFAGVDKNFKSHQAGFENWRAESRNFLQQWPDGWSVPPATIVMPTTSSSATNFVVQMDGSILFTGRVTASTQIKLLPPAKWLAAVRVELIPTPDNDGSVLRARLKATTLQFSASLKSAEGRERGLPIYAADADHKGARYANGSEIIGVKDGWRISAENVTARQAAVYLLDRPVKMQSDDALVVTIRSNVVGCLRIALTPFAAENPLASGGSDLARSLKAKFPSRNEKEMTHRAWLLGTGVDTNAFVHFKQLRRDLLECRNGRALTLVTEAAEPRTTRVLPRGNWQDESGAIVLPLPPHFLAEVPAARQRRLTRLDLARWLVSRDNPLTARTIVNRMWKQFFGAGICSTVDDLGLQGDPPSHPELLDWLAVEFMDSGWDVKHMVRLMVTSTTYRQSSNLRSDLREIDPNNRLLASQNPRRLEAEFVRDNALEIAGLINLEVGGPSSHPYQPPGYYANLQFPDRDYVADKDERQYRRGVYAHWQRTFLQPMLANFDAPAREECTANRTVSNTPQQALTLLNDPTFVEAARVFAQQVLHLAESDDDRLEEIFRRALGRSIQARERNSLEQFLHTQRAHYRENIDEAKQLLRVGLAPKTAGADETEVAAWTQVCRVVLNLQETISIY